MATIYVELADQDKALEFLEKAHQVRALELWPLLKVNFQIDSVRSHSRFQNLLRQVGLAN